MTEKKGDGGGVDKGVQPEGAEVGRRQEQEQERLVGVQPPCGTHQRQPERHGLQQKQRERRLWRPGRQRRIQQRDRVHQATAHGQPKEGEPISKGSEISR